MRQSVMSASTKTELQREIEVRGVDSSRFVPGHPLAGREVSGPGAARADLFADRVWAFTPTPSTDPERVANVADLVATLGAVPVVTTAVAHDRAVALTSHTPQVVASLVAAGLKPLGDVEVRLSGQGLRDVTRLAASDPDLWTEILTSNAAPVAEALGGLIDRLAEVRDGLVAGEAARVRSALADGVDGHRKVPGKHGSAPVAYAVVPVVVADRPGELGRLFADAGVTRRQPRGRAHRARPGSADGTRRARGAAGVGRRRCPRGCGRPGGTCGGRCPRLSARRPATRSPGRSVSVQRFVDIRLPAVRTDVDKQISRRDVPCGPLTCHVEHLTVRPGGRP